MDDFGPKLDYFCEQQGIKLYELATLMEVHRNTIDNWKARGRPPNPEITAKLAKKLNLKEEETNALLLSAGYAPKYSAKESNVTFPLRAQQIGANSLENSIRAIVVRTIEQVPSWLEVVRETIFDKEREVMRGKRHSILHLDEREQRQHLELALKNAVEGGLAMCHTAEEQDQYRQVLDILSESGAHSDALRRDALKPFMLSETPDLTEFNTVYNHSVRIRTLTNKKPGPDRDVTPYLSCFFDALLAELYTDQFFRQQMSDVLQSRASKCMRYSLINVIATLKESGERLTDSYTAEEFERDVEKYTTYIERILQRFKVVGVVPKGREKIADPALNNIFVPVRVAIEGQKSYEQVNSSMLDVLEKHSHVVLLGGPGSGKSTAIRYLAWSHAAANLPNAPEGIGLLRGQPLPLRIELRRLSATRARHPEYDILTYVSEILLGQGGCDVNQEMFRQLLERRGMLLLFDGLDEVATLAERSQMIEEIENFALSYPGNRIVVTSRPIGYDLARFANGWFVRVDIQTFNDEQIRQFLERWYQHILGLGVPIPQEDQEEMEVFYETLKKNERLHKLAENPLLLSVITELHRYKRLPERRIEIYDECAELLLERWASLKGTDIRWKDIRMSREDQFACVAYLGMILHERSQDKQNERRQGSQKVEESSTDVTGRFLQREIECFIKEQKLIAEVTKQRREAERFLALMQEEAGLIVERGKGEDGEELYGFIHRTFQEYFAAMDIYEQYEQEDTPEIVSEFLQEHLHDPHWQEVILLLISKMRRKPVTKLLGQIIEGRLRSRRSKYRTIVRQDLFFVSECLCEGVVVENELAQNVIEELEKVVRTSAFPAQRTNALEHFRKLVRTQQYSDLTDMKLRVLLNTPLEISAKTAIATILYESSLKSIEKRTEVAQVFFTLAKQSDITLNQSVDGLLSLYSISPEGSQEEYAVEEKLLEMADGFYNQPRNFYTVFLGKTAKKDNTRKRLIQSLLNIARRRDIPFEQTLRAIQPIYYEINVESQEHKEAQAILFALARREDISFDQWLSLIGTLYHYFCPEGYTLAFQLTSQFVSDPSIPFQDFLKAAQTLSNAIYSDHWAESQGDFWPFHDVASLAPTLVKKAQNSLERVLQAIDLYDIPYTITDDKMKSVKEVFELSKASSVSNEVLIDILKQLKRCGQQFEDETKEMFLRLTQQPQLSIEQIVQLAQVYLYSNEQLLSKEQDCIAQLLLQYYQNLDIPSDQALLAITTLYKLTPRSSKQHQQASEKLWHLVRSTNLTHNQLKLALGALISSNDTSFIEKMNILKIAIASLSIDDIQNLFREHIRYTNWGKPDIVHVPLIAGLSDNKALPEEVRNSLYKILAESVPHLNLLSEE